MRSERPGPSASTSIDRVVATSEEEDDEEGNLTRVVNSAKRKGTRGSHQANYFEELRQYHLPARDIGEQEKGARRKLVGRIMQNMSKGFAVSPKETWKFYWVKSEHIQKRLRMHEQDQFKTFGKIGVARLLYNPGVLADRYDESILSSPGISEKIICVTVEGIAEKNNAAGFSLMLDVKDWKTAEDQAETDIRRKLVVQRGLAVLLREVVKQGDLLVVINSDHIMDSSIPTYIIAGRNCVMSDAEAEQHVILFRTDSHERSSPAKDNFVSLSNAVTERVGILKLNGIGKQSCTLIIPLEPVTDCDMETTSESEAELSGDEEQNNAQNMPPPPNPQSNGGRLPDLSQSQPQGMASQPQVGSQRSTVGMARDLESQRMMTPSQVGSQRDSFTDGMAKGLESQRMMTQSQLGSQRGIFTDGMAKDLESQRMMTQGFQTQTQRGSSSSTDGMAKDLESQRMLSLSPSRTVGMSIHFESQRISSPSQEGFQTCNVDGIANQFESQRIPSQLQESEEMSEACNVDRIVNPMESQRILSQSQEKSQRLKLNTDGMTNPVEPEQGSSHAENESLLSQINGMASILGSQRVSSESEGGSRSRVSDPNGSAGFPESQLIVSQSEFVYQQAPLRPFNPDEDSQRFLTFSEENEGEIQPRGTSEHSDDTRTFSAVLHSELGSELSEHEELDPGASPKFPEVIYVKEELETESSDSSNPDSEEVRIYTVASPTKRSNPIEEVKLKTCFVKLTKMDFIGVDPGD